MTLCVIVVLAGVIMYARIDVSGYDTSKVLPETVWATVPEGQKILVASEAWELASSSVGGETVA
jgi:hypothetical protein